MQLRPDLTLTYTDGGFSIGSGFAYYRFEGVSPAGRVALEDLQAAPCDESQLIDRVLAAEGGSTLPTFMYLLNQLKQRGSLRYSIAAGPLAGLCVTPQAEPFTFEPERLPADQAFRWSPLVYCRPEDGQWRLACPLGNAQVSGLDQPLFWLLLPRLRDWHTLDELAQRFPELTAAEWRAVVAMFEAARTLEWPMPAGQPTPPEQSWEFHDLLFHTRSRLGKHQHPYGGTFPRQGQGAPPPATAERLGTQVVALPRPTEPIAGPGLWDVLERRTSRRTYDVQNPLSLEQLGHLLHYTARTKGVWATPDGGDFARKPYPAGGGLYELEVYPVVAQCAGLEGGLYHYNSLRHELHQLAPLTPEVQRLLDLAWFTAGRESRPQVLLAVTARFQRVNWKYQSVAYALILKHVGVLYQTLYLAATALDLAPCALGGGDATLFAKAAGLHELEETTVGEFLLGSLPPT